MLFAYVLGADPDPLKFNFESRYIDRLAPTHDPNNTNFAGIRDRTIDHAFEVAATSLSNTVRRKQYRIVQGRVNQMAYWIPLEAKPFLYAEDGRIRNLSVSLTGAWLYWNSWAWKTTKH